MKNTASTAPTASASQLNGLHKIAGQPKVPSAIAPTATRPCSATLRLRLAMVAEAAVALAIALNFYNNHTTIDVDHADELKG